MTTQKYPIHFEVQWNDSFEESPCIQLKIVNQSETPITAEVVWGYWSYEDSKSSNQIMSSQGPTGCSIQWAEEMIDRVNYREAKHFYMFGDELQKMVAISQVLSPDLHCLWARVDGQRIPLLEGNMLALWLEQNVVPLFEI